MGIQRELCFLWLATTSLILWVNGTNVHVKEDECGAWRCDGLEIGGQSGKGSRKFLMSCNRKMLDPNDKKKTISIYAKNCFTANPHDSPFYNKNQVEYYQNLRNEICERFDDKTGKAILKKRAVGPPGRPVDPKSYKYDEVLQNNGKPTLRTFTKAELDILRSTGVIANHTRYGKVTFRQGPRKGAHGGYERVNYQLQDEFKPERYIDDKYGINWDELNPSSSQCK